MTISRRDRKSLAASCLALWLLAFGIGVADGCIALPAGHALETSLPINSHGEAGDDGDGDVGCTPSCADGAPPAGDLLSLHGLFGSPALIVQTRTDNLFSLLPGRAVIARHRGLFCSGVPPTLGSVRLIL
jgi:hypothetical protein